MSADTSYGRQIGVATTRAPLGESLPSPFARISWGAIFAGLFVVVAVQILLNMLGAGIGLGMVDPQQPGQSGSPATWGIAAGLWWVVSNLVALFLGGHVAARLAGSWRAHDAALHGVIVWAATLLLGAILVASAVGSVVGGAANVLGSTVSGAGRMAANAVGSATGGASGFDLDAQIGRLVRPNDPTRMTPDQAKGELATTLPRLIAGDTSVDRNRVVQLVSAQAGIPPEEASTRLDQWTNEARQARQQVETQAREAADTAASTASRTALWGFAAFLLGAIAGGLGGWMGMRPELMVPTDDVTVRRA